MRHHGAYCNTGTATVRSDGGWDGRLDRSDYYLVETLLAVPTAVLGTLVYCLFRPGAWGDPANS